MTIRAFSTVEVLAGEEYPIKVGTPAKLGITTVYRTEVPDTYYKGLAIWGKGRYYSLTFEDSNRINAGKPEDIKTYTLPNNLKLMEFDLTWTTDRKRSDSDYKQLHSLIGKPPKGIDGFVVRSNSMQYGYSQVVIFPHAQIKVRTT